MERKRGEGEETSVVVSLQELVALGQKREREEQEAAMRRAEELSRLEGERKQRAVEEERERLRAEDARRQREESERRLHLAQIEAGKLAEIETRKMAEQHRMHMELLAAQRAHEQELARIAGAARKGTHPALLWSSLGLGALLCAGLVFVGAVKPKRDAREALDRAAMHAASEDPSDWNRAGNELAVALDKDPGNPDLARISSLLVQKQTAWEKKRDQQVKGFQSTIAELRDKLRTLESAPPPAPAPTVITKPKPQPVPPGPGPQIPTTGPVCPPGVSGIPLCK